MYKILLIKIIPFLAVIVFELIPQALPAKFIAVYDRFFNSEGGQFVGESLDEVLEEKFEGNDAVSDEDLESLVHLIQNEVGINDEAVADYMKDYVKYADDWLRTKISISITFVSSVAILYGDALADPRDLGAILIISAGVAISLYLLYILVDYFFEKRHPHGYSNERILGISHMSWVIVTVSLIVALIIVYVEISLA